MTPPEIEIRRITSADGALLDRADGTDLFDKPLRADAVARFLASADHHLLLALEAGEPVGMVSGVELTHPDKGTEMFLYELSVLGRAQRRGIGTALVEALAALADERGCRGMWVLTDEDNAPGLGTYRNAGATIEERTYLLEWRL
ncbi:MAG TPA: GNAT family N-acetyltransferase [Candidatus Limnocylindrales bacterium]|nr:GNAT family N-acetyltransferase [Candidatus Limnocylindrales bacterium]